MPLILSPEMSFDQQLEAIVAELNELDVGLNFAIRYARLAAHALCTRTQLVETDVQCEEWERKRGRLNGHAAGDTDPPPRTDPSPPTDRNGGGE